MNDILRVVCENLSLINSPRMNPPAILDSLILTVRGQKVLLDADLAAIYGVATKRLNEQVKRNAERFPEDFVFQLTDEEKCKVVANCDHLTRLKFSKSRPYAFTEHGAIMAATVLNSPEAVKMSIFVVRAFVKMREHLASNAEILQRLAEIDKTLLDHDKVLHSLWRQIQPLLTPPPDLPRKEIGFHVREQPPCYKTEKRHSPK
jgi:hypothetical protein